MHAQPKLRSAPPAPLTHDVLTPSDEAFRAAVCDALVFAGCDCNDVTVSTEGRVVLLSGSVPSSAAEGDLILTALGLPTVHSVCSSLEVGPELVARHEN